MQQLLAGSSIAAVLASAELPTEYAVQVQQALDRAVADYRTMLLSGTVDARAVCLAGKALGDELERTIGFTHEQYVELARQLMVIGLHAGFFGLYIDYSLDAADNLVANL